MAQVSEVKQNREFCDDRYVSWRWMIGGLVGLVMVIGGITAGSVSWGKGIENEVSACRDFRLEYQDKIDNVLTSTRDVQANTDTLKTLLRAQRKK